VSGENGDNCIVLYPGTNGTNTLSEAEEVLQKFQPGDWIVQQNEINLGGEIMNLAARKGKENRFLILLFLVIFIQV
jgi:ribokinase